MACSVPVTLTSSSLHSHRLSPPQATGCVLTKAFVPFAAGHCSSSWSCFHDIQLSENLSCTQYNQGCREKGSNKVSLSYVNSWLLCNEGKQKHAVKPVYDQTTEFRLTFSRERGWAKRMMKLVLVVLTEGDVIPLLFANYQLVVGDVCAFVALFFLPPYDKCKYCPAFSYSLLDTNIGCVYVAISGPSVVCLGGRETVSD